MEVGFADLIRVINLNRPSRGAPKNDPIIHDS